MPVRVPGSSAGADLPYDFPPVRLMESMQETGTDPGEKDSPDRLVDSRCEDGNKKSSDLDLNCN